MSAVPTSFKMPRSDAFRPERLILDGMMALKGLRHHDIAVLGQFCAEVISSSLYPYKKYSCRDMKETSNRLHQRTQTIKMFGDFSGQALH